MRAEVTANTCFGTAVKVREHVGRFFRDVAGRADEVTQRCRTALQPKAAAPALAVPYTPNHVVPTLA